MTQGPGSPSDRGDGAEEEKVAPGSADVNNDLPFTEDERAVAAAAKFSVKRARDGVEHFVFNQVHGSVGARHKA